MLVCVCVFVCLCDLGGCAKVSQGQCSDEGLFSDKWTTHIDVKLNSSEAQAI